jgi:excisionase family DNA binding protein
VVAAAMSLSDWSIKRLIASGELASLKVSGRRLIPRQAIEELIARGLSENQNRVGAA